MEKGVWSTRTSQDLPQLTAPQMLGLDGAQGQLEGADARAGAEATVHLLRRQPRDSELFPGDDSGGTR